MLAIMLIAGLNYANSAALFLTFLLGGFALVSMHQCHRNLLRASFITASAPPMFAGSTGVLSVTLGNEARFRALRHRNHRARQQAPAASTSRSRGRRRRACRCPLRQARRAAHRPATHLDLAIPTTCFAPGRGCTCPSKCSCIRGRTAPRPCRSRAATRPAVARWPWRAADEWRSLRPFRDGDSPRQVRVDRVRARLAAAREGVQRARRGAAPVRLRASCAHLDVEARLEQLRALDRRCGRARRALQPRHAGPLRRARHAAPSTATNASALLARVTRCPGQNDAR